MKHYFGILALLILASKIDHSGSAPPGPPLDFESGWDEAPRMAPPGPPLDFESVWEEGPRMAPPGPPLPLDYELGWVEEPRMEEKGGEIFIFTM